jgi:serine/threonine protein kinase
MMTNRRIQIGRYRLLNLLSRSRYTAVWLGEHVRLKKKVAIKILFPGEIQDIDEQHRTKRRFIREAGTLAQFDYPYIVQVFDSGEVDGWLYFVMEYAPYGSLARRHRPGKRLPLSKVRVYTSQVGRTIHYVHVRGFIHRDIKPQNIFLKTRNMVLLGDFGLVMHIRSRYYPRMFWEFGGTSAYMAPEQRQGAPCPASDQYAFATMVFEWLTGHSPFQGTDEEIAWQRRNLSPPSMRTIVPEIPAAVERVVLTGLQHTPDRRFKTTLDFTLAFEEACRHMIVRLPYDASASRWRRVFVSH